MSKRLRQLRTAKRQREVRSLRREMEYLWVEVADLALELCKVLQGQEELAQELHRKVSCLED